jgi:hypothetical protein
MALVVVASATSATKLSSASAAAPAGFFLRARFVDLHGASAKITAVEGGDSFCCGRCVGHFHECETSRTARIAIGHDADTLDCAVRFEQSAKLWFSGAMRDIADEQILHDSSFSGREWMYRLGLYASSDTIAAAVIALY